MSEPTKALASEPRDRILLFIPTYNCARQIGRVLAKVGQSPKGVFEQCLVIDNRSTDGTAEAALEAAAHVSSVPVTVVRNQQNYGLGGSHKAAFAYAQQQGFTHVVVLHGDDQGNLADVLPVLQAGLHRRFACCLGSRFALGARLNGYSLTRRLGNYVFNALFSLVSGRWVSDLGSGLNVFSRRVFADPALFRYSDDLRFNCYLLLGLVDAGLPFRYFPISWSEADQISNVKIVSQSLNTLKILWQYRFGRRAYRAADHRTIPRDAYRFDALSLPAPATPLLEEVAR